MYATASIDSANKELVIKLVNVSGDAQVVPLAVEGIKKLNPNARQIVLQSNDLKAMNTFENPLLVSPKESAVKLKGKKMDYEALPYSVNVIRISMQ